MNEQHRNSPSVAGSVRRCGVATVALCRRFRDKAGSDREAALRASERNTADIIESISDGFLAVSRDWQITYINRRAVRYKVGQGDEEGGIR